MFNPIGQTYGNLVVVEEAPRKILERNGKKKRVWRMVVVENNITGERSTVMLSNLMSGVNKGTGHGVNTGAFKRKISESDMIWKRVGRLVIHSEIISNTRERKFKCVCDCGKDAVVALTKLRSGATKSCGCLSKDIRKNKRGKLHHAWLGDSSNKKLIAPIMKYINKWRFHIRAKFNHTCQKCGYDAGFLGDGLEAHHIVPMTADMDKALDPENGICLCINCHRSFHKKCGRYGADADKLYAWLNGGM